MTRQEKLRKWPKYYLGGPILINSDNAIEYAKIAFNNNLALKTLVKQRNRLNRQYRYFNLRKGEYIDVKLDIAFRIQFANDAIREIDRLLKEKSPDKDFLELG